MIKTFEQFDDNPFGEEREWGEEINSTDDINDGDYLVAKEDIFIDGKKEFTKGQLHQVARCWKGQFGPMFSPMSGSVYMAGNFYYRYFNIDVMKDKFKKSRN